MIWVEWIRARAVLVTRPFSALVLRLAPIRMNLGARQVSNVVFQLKTSPAVLQGAVRPARLFLPELVASAYVRNKGRRSIRCNVFERKKVLPRTSLFRSCLVRTIRSSCLAAGPRCSARYGSSGSLELAPGRILSRAVQYLERYVSVRW